MSPSEDPDERVVAITGATGNLGPAVVRAFAEEGNRLALLARDTDRIDALIQELPGGPERHLAVAVDLASATAATNAAQTVNDQLGDVSALLHLVGTFKGGSTDAADEDWDALLELNLWSTVRVLRAFLPQITSADGGRIVTVSSPFARDPSEATGAYGASKASVDALTLGIAREVRDSGATANVVVVRSIRTAEERRAAAPDDAAAWTTPEEIAQAMLWLCSAGAAAVNGARLPLYGRG